MLVLKPTYVQGKTENKESRNMPPGTVVKVGRGSFPGPLWLQV